MSRPDAPALAVVGCVNMGKSSIVATLVEDDAILVAPEAGSTTECAAYDLRLGEDAVFTLIDTPGFQNARRALAWIEDWLQAHQQERATPTAAVRAFHAEMKKNPAFAHEVKLLGPILHEGAGVLYVVDGTQPYLPRYEAEMRILAMTGAPRMGVINLHAESSPHVEEWEEALRPWFKVVRFDAHGSDPEARLRLFASFRGVDDAWAPVVDEALARLRKEREARHDLAAAAIAHLLIDALGMKEEAPVETNRDAQVKALADKLFERLREREARERREVEALYRHHHLHRSEDALALLDKDLLDTEQWRLMGLSARQLAGAGAAAGAVAGGVLDASVGGASFFAGTLVGAAVGGLGAVWSAQGLAKVRVLGSPLGGRRLQVEAPTTPQFPFVLLDRALLHWRMVAGRAHARRDALDVRPAEEASGVVADLPASARKSLTQKLAHVRKREGDIVDVDRRELIREIRALAPD
jgi:hypothetical protein